VRIGLIAPPWVPVPPTAYGGTELVVDELARGLDRLGHQVRLFTIGASTCPVQTDFLSAEPMPAMGSSVDEAAHVLAAYDALADVDVIHDHTLLGPLLAAGAETAAPPVVVTHHGVFDSALRRVFARTAQSAAVVAISRSQARAAGAVPITAVVPHGIDLDHYRVGEGRSGALLFIGRMSPVKGAHRAIRIARDAGLPLVIVTRIRDATEREYYDSAVRPLLGADVRVLVEPDLGLKADLLRDSAALVNPITWPEPFGLVMIEALASGTPVLAFPHGAAPEIVEHGRTGYLAGTERGLTDAVRRLDELDRRACRRAAEARFSARRMVADYLAVYRHVSANTPTGSRPPARLLSLADARARH
jgi:glycosyltransferase involved in cell wall biosynthesis